VLQGYLHCLNNLAACHLSTEQFFKAKEVATKLLSVDPRNTKGLLRAAKATLALADFEECELCLQTVLSDDAENVAAKAEMARLRRARAVYRADARAVEMKIAKGLFAGDAAKSEAVTPAPTAADTDGGCASPEEAGKGGNKTTACSADGGATKAEGAGGSSNALLLVGTSLLALIVSLIIAFYFYGK